MESATTPAQVKLFVSSPSYRKSCQGYKLPKLMIVYIDLYTLQAFERRNSPLPENHASCCYTHTYTPLHPYSCRQQPHAVCLYSQFKSPVTHICTTGGTTRERGAFLEGGLIQSEDTRGGIVTSQTTTAILSIRWFPCRGAGVSSCYTARWRGATQSDTRMHAHKGAFHSPSRTCKRI